MASGSCLIELGRAQRGARQTAIERKAKRKSSTFQPPFSAYRDLSPGLWETFPCSLGKLFPALWGTFSPPSANVFPAFGEPFPWPLGNLFPSHWGSFSLASGDCANSRGGKNSSTDTKFSRESGFHLEKYKKLHFLKFRRRISNFPRKMLKSFGKI